MTLNIAMLNERPLLQTNDSPVSSDMRNGKETERKRPRG